MSETPLARAQRMVGMPGTYILGAGDYRPVGDRDEPFTKHWDTGKLGCDCWGFVAWAFQQRRHHPGYNHGGSVEDWVNVDSAIEDGFGIQGKEPKAVLWRGIERSAVQPGDLILWPSIRRGGKRVRIGHVGIVETVVGADFQAWTVLQCSSKVPIGRAIRRTSAGPWNGIAVFLRANETNAR